MIAIGLWVAGVLGRHNASSAMAYRSFFPTVISRWWSEVVKGVENVRRHVWTGMSEIIAGVFGAQLLL